MKVLVLGSAAGGGFPQWNCNCENCRLARQNHPHTKPRTQSSLAVTTDNKRWLLLNASPDVRQQLASNPQMHPSDAARHSPVSSVILTNADVDHIAGLLTLRERQPLAVYATPRVHTVLRANSVFNVLNDELVDRREVFLNSDVDIHDAAGDSLSIRIHCFSVPGKVALFLENPDAGENFGSVEEDTVGLYVTNTEGSKGFFYMPGCAAMPEDLKTRINGASLVFMDGTTWINDEMAQTGVGEKTSARMGHMAMSGPDGSIVAFANLDIGKKVFVHMNNTNSVLNETSSEHRQAVDAGWIIAEDGMEFTL